MVDRRCASSCPSPFPLASHGQSVLWVFVQSVLFLGTVVSACQSLLVFLSLSLSIDLHVEQCGCLAIFAAFAALLLLTGVRNVSAMPYAAG